MTLPHDVEWTLSKLFEQEILNYKYQNHINFIRSILMTQDHLVSSSDFNSMAAFRSIDE